MTASGDGNEVPHKMTILVYRRTHTGDPDLETHRFGIHDCMGRVRDWDYDAVIGIGGTHPDPGYEGIKEKITWVGITPIKPETTEAGDADVNTVKKINPEFSGFRGRVVEFEKFVLWDEDGPEVSEYPALYTYMFKEGHIPRAAKNILPDCVVQELHAILERAESDANCSIQTQGKIALSSESTHTESRHQPSCVQKTRKNL
ncbi:hypothetical protein [Lamprocystis purpurea]|jgi:hypothetical protein|uniref:hypothetical protein n=1 Tax=Lamprocystis purpurea TaxID=61598 RepID=UPI0012FA9CF1|nr:hypothetical protein [Lamprocystis purpurea]MBV5347256.1 hypothetical protein [bacterium]